MSDDRWFLVKRWHGKFHGVIAYDNEQQAIEAYEDSERFGETTLAAILGQEVVLLGADRLATLIATHGNWFDEPKGLDAAVEAVRAEKEA